MGSTKQKRSANAFAHDWHPTCESVGRTAWFKTVVRDLGFVDYWRARGWPAQCRPAGADDFVCD
jgi:hypothetical protein